MFEGIDSTGQVFEGYRITNELASTASSRVVLGESLSPMTPHQRAFIKWFSSKHLTTQQEIDQFLQEMDTISGLLHPFILTVFSSGVVKAVPYVIEAYASNGSLQDRLQHMLGLPFSWEDSCAILTQLGQALSYVHERDITHGNLRPQNVLFNDKGDVLLADFSLHALATHPNNITVSETSVYQAPELLPGHASKQGDQYALGCIAYEMLTGYKPFMTPSLSKPGIFYRTEMLMIPTHFNSALSSRSEEAILKAMAKEPTQRHPDIRAFLSALGISSDTGDQATSTAIDPLSLVSDPMEQTQPRMTAVSDAIEDTAKRSALKASTLLLTSDPAQTGVSVEAEEHLPGVNHTLLTSSPFGQPLDPAAALMDVSTPDTLAHSISRSPEHYPFEHNLFANASAANDKTIIYAPAHAKSLSTGSAKSFFKRRGIGMVIVCVVAVCIFAAVFLALSVSGSAQGHNTVPTVGPLFSTPASTVVYPTSSSLSTQTPESTAPQQGPGVTPSPTSMPTVPVQPTSIPTSTPSEPTSPPQPTPTPTPVHCLPVLC